MTGKKSRGWFPAFGLAFFLTSILEGDAFAQFAPCPFWGSGMMGGTWIGGIFMMLFWILIIVAVVFFIRWLVSTGKVDHKTVLPGWDSPLDILKKRYAKGEISKEEFDSMRRDLE